MGEIRNLSEPRVQELVNSIKERGFETKHPIFINVEYDGSANINEGNRRYLVAKHLKFNNVPVEIRYYSGGELMKGEWHPDRVSKVGMKAPKTIWAL